MISTFIRALLVGVPLGFLTGSAVLVVRHLAAF